MRALQLILGLFYLVFTLTASAGSITVEFTAIVNFVDDYGNALENNVNPGDQITGTYTLDLNMNDEDPNPDYSSFYIPQPLPAGLGFSLNLPGLSYIPTNDSTDISVNIYNGPGFDHYTIMSCCSAGSLSNGSIVEHVLLDLVDDLGNTLNTADLNTDLAILNAMPNKMIFFDGRSAGGAIFHVEATVSKLIIPGSSCQSPAATNRLSFNAEIIDIFNSGSTALGVNVGDKISGKYSFNPETPDSDTSPELAYYHHAQGDPLGNIELTIAGSTSIGNKDLHDFNVYVGNYANGTGSDNFSVNSWNEAIPLPNGAVIHGVSIDFHDPSGSMLSSTALLDSNPTTLFGWTHHDVYISGTNADGSSFNILAQIYAINTAPDVTPAPSPITISPASGTFIIQQHFITAIILDANLPLITNHAVTLSSSASGFTDPVNCDVGPVTLDNRQTLICTEPVYMLEAGENTLSVQVELEDGSVLNETANWELLSN